MASSIRLTTELKSFCFRRLETSAPTDRCTALRVQLPIVGEKSVFSSNQRY